MRLRISVTAVLLLISPLVHEVRSGEQIPEPIIVLERESDVFQVSPEYRLSIFDDGTVLFKGRSMLNLKNQSVPRLIMSN